MRDLFLCILTALIVVVQCETIHFTNSPTHLVGSTNITSYKLLVKNADPITIIEANKEIKDEPNTTYQQRYHPNDRIDINVDDMPMQDYHMKLMTNMGGSSHYMDNKNTQNVHGTVGITISGGPSNGPPSNLKDLKTSDDSDTESSSVSAKKVVYSPILLKKFMKEYSEKLKNADNSIKNEILKIHEKIHQQQNVDDDKSGNDEPLVFDKSIEEVEQKFNLNGYRDNYNDVRRKRPSDGWVTLEAVPWSSSSVSKWHPHGESDTRRRPQTHSARPYQSKFGPDKFPSHEDFDDDYYGRPKPSYSSDRDSRPSVYTAWTKPHGMNSNGRPKPQPYSFSESVSFNAHKPDRPNRPDRPDRPDRDRYSSRPWSSGGDIITDNRPSNFPSEYHDSSGYYDDERLNTASSSLHSSYEERPSEGNGDWVLISTTKGYQIPGRRQQGNRALSKPSDAQTSVIVKAPQSMRMHKALKLTVLPALDPALNSTFSTDPKRKPTTTLHSGGMIEIDATHQTIEDDVRATMQAQKKFTTAKQPVKASSAENKHKKLLKGNFKLEEKTA